MDKSERFLLISRGNELFQTKDYKNALKIFLATSYVEGIANIADVMYHEKKDPVSALKLYKKAGKESNVEKLSYEMAQLVRLMIKEDKVLEAQKLGKDFNTGYKVSGQTPKILPTEAVKIAKERLGIHPAVSQAEKDGRVQDWKPITISRNELKNRK
ncbi:MAG: hypothetical protein ACRCTQ_01790 [Brevinemataceae bacterium]